MLRGVGQVAGIDDDGKVRPAAQLVGGVDWIVEAFIEVGAERGSKMGARGEAEHAYAIGIDVPLGCVLANHAEGALRILQSRGGFGIRTGVGHAILHQHAGHVDGVEPVADLCAFKIDGENLVAAAGKDNHRRSRCGAFRRINRQRRIRDVAEANQRTARDEFVSGLGGVDFGRWIRRGAGSTAPATAEG